MVEVSCFYIHSNNSINFTFIKFNNFMKVILNKTSVILTNKQIIENSKLFQIYVLSLLCTKDTSSIEVIYNDRYKKNFYGIAARKYWQCNYYTDEYEIIELEKSNFKNPRNPLKMMEPKRESGMKKIRKFMKLFNLIRINPLESIQEYYEIESIQYIDYFSRYISYNRKIYVLSMIKSRYGDDIYKNIIKFI